MHLTPTQWDRLIADLNAVIPPMSTRINTLAEHVMDVTAALRLAEQAKNHELAASLENQLACWIEEGLQGIIL